MKTSSGFLLPMSDEGRQQLRALKDAVGLIAGGKERRRWEVLDTFDWRLLSADCVLLRDRTCFELHRCAGDELIARESFKAAAKHLAIDDFPVGALRDKVSTVMDIRAVMPRAEVIREVEVFRIENTDGKTTVRVELETLFRPVAGQKAMPFRRLMRVVALKGYESQAEAVSRQLAEAGLAEHDDTRHYAFAALEASGVTPFDYASKIKLELSPNLTAREACTRILLASLEQVQVNVPGMLADIDSEFLHDFRVALRRTRSLLQLVRGVYAEEQVLAHKTALGDVMKRTNRLRDLDVYLLEQGDYAKLLPPALRPGLEDFFADLCKERSKVFKQFVKALQSAQVTRELKAWDRFVRKEALSSHATVQDGDAPVKSLANQLLMKRFKRIIKDGRKIADETPDEAVHELRIQFKKLRYLLEFFRSLYDSDELDFLIKRSRKIQNVLGAFNDVCVQQETISQYLKSVDLKRPEAVQLCAALGALVAELERKRVCERKKFRAAFDTLDDARVLSVADHLFRPIIVEVSTNPPMFAPAKKPKPKKAKKISR
ncbi:CHAD domain-containing protein [Cerasicoccus maritimus]|uniref:CHAD domain-containing protein n=1 Tax=Cerasicoccus maritimus TaxID=490089 RepID=UPI002852C901|nr:CHAD domain-containing protein [Cerasicoccus maritimus]